MLAIPSTRALVIAPNTIVSEIVAELGRDRAIFILLITAILKTAFAEELLFRGLIGKRLINWLGFGLGNGIQAALFGSVHLLLFSSAQWQDQRSAVILSLLAVTILGWVNGWLNERLGKGSIIPGWIVHGLSNAISYLTAAFFLL